MIEVSSRLVNCADSTRLVSYFILSRVRACPMRQPATAIADMNSAGDDDWQQPSGSSLPVSSSSPGTATPVMDNRTGAVDLITGRVDLVTLGITHIRFLKSLSQISW